MKGHHSGLQEEIETIFKDAIENDFKGVDAAQYQALDQTLEKNRGRVEERIYYSISKEDFQKKPSKKAFQVKSG